MNFITRIFRNKRARFKQYAHANAEEAFTYKGKTYYHFTDSFKMPAARAICSLAIYEELKMRCNAEYLQKHIRATELILNPANKRIDLGTLALINQNLKERLELAPFPDHIYKLASITYFDENENPNSYDFAYNEKKITEWKKDPEILSFFLKTPFKDLMPFGNISDESAGKYFESVAMIDKLHRKTLQDILSREN